VAKLVAVVSFALIVAAPPAAAQFPTKPIHLIVPAAPGGGTDIAARSFRREIARWEKVLKAADVQLKQVEP
jgi:tripartite-type tricarboxylate transporter receptor subunit TctC